MLTWDITINKIKLYFIDSTMLSVNIMYVYFIN